MLVIYWWSIIRRIDFISMKVAETEQHGIDKPTQQNMDFLLGYKGLDSTPKMHPFYWSLCKNK